MLDRPLLGHLAGLARCGAWYAGACACVRVRQAFVLLLVHGRQAGSHDSKQFEQERALPGCLLLCRQTDGQPCIA
jgi:hypothetical protein